MLASHRAMTAYQNVGTGNTVASAPPEQLTRLLLDGACERIARAKGHLQRGQVAERGAQTGAAIAIVDELRASLRHEVAPALCANLDPLYDYIQRLLLRAGVERRIAPLDEAAHLLGEIQIAWQAVAAQNTPAQAVP